MNHEFKVPKELETAWADNLFQAWIGLWCESAKDKIMTLLNYEKSAAGYIADVFYLEGNKVLDSKFMCDQDQYALLYNAR